MNPPLMITGMILAPITGIFVLGIFTKRANSTGVWVGTVASIAANYYAKFHMNLHALAYLTRGVHLHCRRLSRQPVRP